MYLRFYDLHEPPFELTPDPKFLFLSHRHREALSNVIYGVSAGKSLTVITGEAGTGKTTLLAAAFDAGECHHVHWVCLSNPVLTRRDFVRTLASRFDLSARAAESKACLLDELELLLRRRRRHGQTTVLVVDEAQSLTYDVLEEIRLLANIETATEKLLPLVLAGQPEFAARLNEPALRQLKQRVALRCTIAPFDLADTAAYIASRVSTAGGDSSSLFTRDAIKTIHEHARGIPRSINVICDNALLSGLALGRRPVDRAIIADVVHDFDLTPDSGAGGTAGVVEPEAPARDAADEPEAARPVRGMFEGFSRTRRFAFFGGGRA